MTVPELPRIETERLVLRPWTLGDVPELVRLAGEREVAEATLRLPHPYEESRGIEWISGHAAAWGRRESVPLAITSPGGDGLVGSISLQLAPAHARAELGYWIGRPFWGRGYATEAAAALVDWGFRNLDLLRVYAGHFAGNPASGRVLEKLGMRREGVLRGHLLRWGRSQDDVIWGLLRAEWEARRREAPARPPPDAEPSGG